LLSLLGVWNGNNVAIRSRKGQQPHNRRLKQRIGDGISRFMRLAKIRVDHGIPSGPTPGAR